MILQEIATVIYEAISFINTSISGGGTVYVHCHQGVSRSSSMVMAYLMWKHDRSLDDTFTDVKKLRGVANPNAGFICRLLEFRQRLVETRGAGPISSRLYRMA